MIAQELEAVFEDGKFRPLEPPAVPLSGGQRVRLTVEREATPDDVLALPSGCTMVSPKRRWTRSSVSSSTVVRFSTTASLDAAWCRPDRYGHALGATAGQVGGSPASA